MKAVSSKFNSINKKAVKGVFFGVLVGILITIILIMITAAAITAIGKLPDGSLQYISLALLGIGGLAGGYISGRIYKHNALLLGIVTGFIMFVIVFLAGIDSISGGLSIFTAFKLVVLLIMTSLGAVFAVNKKEKLRYK